MTKTLLAVLLTLTLLCSLFTVAAFAEETTASQDDVTTAEDVDDTTVDAEESGAEEPDETTDDGEAEESTTAAETTTAAAGSTENDKLTTGEIVSIVIGAVIGVIVIVLTCMIVFAKDDGTAGKDGSKVPFGIRGKRFFRSCRLEAKKVVWTPWKTVRKNTWVVALVVIACAIVIGVLDLIFSRGIISLAGLF